MLDGISDQLFSIFEIRYFGFSVAVCDLVHDVEAIHVLC